MEPRWNDIDGKTEEPRDKPVPMSHFLPQIPLGLTQAHLGLHCEILATNCLSHGIANVLLKKLRKMLTNDMTSKISGKEKCVDKSFSAI
jgi:hypothetical protein